MNKGRFFSFVLAVLFAVCVLPGCSRSTADERDFNFIFKYGVGAKNELNTFQNEFTRDMIVDPSVTISLTLTEDELTRIYDKMIEIDFFSYPDVFTVPTPEDGIISIVTPYASYYLKVEHEGEIKELSWEDEITTPNEKAEALRSLMKFIREVIENREEYRELPEPRGGYI